MRLSITFVTLALAVTAAAQTSSSSGPYTLSTVVPWPGNRSVSDDGSQISQGVYYLSDRSRQGIDVLDLTTRKTLPTIKGFTGVQTVNGTVDKDRRGPNGMILIPDRAELFVSDGDGSVKVVSIANGTNRIVASIPCHIHTMIDEFGHDSANGIVVATAPDEDIPKIIFISVVNRSVLGQMEFPNGTVIEGPVWNPRDGYMYVSIPGSNLFPGGEVHVIDALTMKTVRRIPQYQCNSQGIVFGPGNQLLLGCSIYSEQNDHVQHVQVIDYQTGEQMANVSGIAGVDIAQYVSALNLYFVAAFQNFDARGNPNPQMGIIDASSLQLVQKIATDNITAHSMSIDPVTSDLIIPVSAEGFRIYSLSKSFKPSPLNVTYMPSTASPNATSASPASTSSATQTSGLSSSPATHLVLTLGHLALSVAAASFFFLLC